MPKLANARVSKVVRTAISSAVERFDEHKPAVGSEGDPEHVHQARVATRRLRSDLRTLRDFVEPSWAEPLRDELRWLGGELGAVRDIEVLRERLSQHAGLLGDADADVARGAIQHLDTEHGVARAELLAALSSPRYEQLHQALHDAAVAPHLTPAADKRARKALPGAVRPTWRHLRRAVRELEQVPSDAALHAVRIRAKRARYAAELARPVIGRRARDLADALARLQDVLGEHQDAVVAGRWLAKTASECSPPEAYALGMLAEVEHGFALVARSAFPGVWDAARVRSLRSWM